MNREEVYQRLTGVFREVFDDDSLVPHDDMTAKDVLEWDSLSNIRLVVSVEREFNIRFSTGEVANLANVGKFVSVIQERVEAPGAP